MNFKRLNPEPEASLLAAFGGGAAAARGGGAGGGGGGALPPSTAGAPPLDMAALLPGVGHLRLAAGAAGLGAGKSAGFHSAS